LIILKKLTMKDVLTSSSFANDILRFIVAIFLLCTLALIGCVVIFTAFLVHRIKYKIMEKIWKRMSPTGRFILLIIFILSTLFRLLK